MKNTSLHSSGYFSGREEIQFQIIQSPASSPLEEFHRLSLVRNLMLAVVQGLGDTDTTSLIVGYNIFEKMQKRISITDK